MHFAGFGSNYERCGRMLKKMFIGFGSIWKTCGSNQKRLETFLKDLELLFEGFWNVVRGLGSMLIFDSQDLEAYSRGLEACLKDSQAFLKDLEAF